MYRLLTIIFVFVLTMQAFTQVESISKTEQKKLAREQRKAEKLTEKKEKAKVTKSILENKKFVLEADYLSDEKGNRIPVTSNINFVAVDSTKGILQIGSPAGIGWNGLGGITVEGNITKYDLKTIERKNSISYSLTIYIMSSLGMYDVQFNISETGYADATVRSTTRGSLKYSGNLIPLELSRVFKGTSTY